MAHKKAQPRPVTVILPPEPPALTPGAARALLKILIKAHEAQAEDESRLEAEQRRPPETFELESSPQEGELSP